MRGADERIDHVVGGAGPAGWVLAKRLSVTLEDRVLRLEVGGRDPSLLIHVPLAMR